MYVCMYIYIYIYIYIYTQLTVVRYPSPRFLAVVPDYKKGVAVKWALDLRNPFLFSG